MINKKLFSTTIYIICLVLFLNACAPATATPTARAAALRTRPTRTPQPPTAVPATSTPLPSPTATPLPPATATLTPAPLMDWSGASVYSSGIITKHFQALITIKVNANIVGQYYAIVQDDKPYTCTTFSDKPHLLYCSGPLAGVEKFVHFALYQKGVTYPIFQADVYMPMIDTPLP